MTLEIITSDLGKMFVTGQDIRERTNIYTLTKEQAIAFVKLVTPAKIGLLEAL